ncbi:MAG: hypothetical protein IIA88_03585, partial [Bacteroidetes bacterium]|nr:hypothetical protein [Bacteroidota bacterium]
MGILIRQSVLGAVFTFLGIAVGAVNIILLFPRVFEEEQFGLIKLLFHVSVLFAQFAQLGMPNVMVKFFPYYRNEKTQHSGFLFFTLFIATAGFILFSAFYFIFRGNIHDYYIENSALFVNYSYLILPISLSLIYFNVFSGYLTSLHNV